jgi:hypothetical protein
LRRRAETPPRPCLLPGIFHVLTHTKFELSIPTYDTAMYLRTYVSQADRCRLADESLKRIENAFRRFKAQALMKEADKLSKEDGVIDVLFGKPRWVA